MQATRERNRHQRGSGVWAVLGGVLALCCFAALGLLGWSWLASSRAAPVTSGEFQRLLDAGQVQRVVVQGEAARVTLTEAGGSQTLRLKLPGSLTSPPSGLISQLEAGGVELRFEQSSQWLSVLLNFMPVLLFLGLFVALPLTALGLLLWRARRPRLPNGEGQV